MSKKSDGLLAEMLDNRWMYTNSATNATLTPQVVGDCQSTKEERHMDSFYFAVLNKNSVHVTVTGSVRDASAAGTVLAQFPMLVGSSAVAQVNFSDMHLIATRGKGFAFTMDTVQPSVTATVNACGWTDSSDDN